MDAIAQLALMHKAQNVFGSDGTFLSFPITPLQYTQSELSFVQTFNVAQLKEFALMVNRIPTGEAWQPGEERYLWDAYGNVLAGHDTQLAQSIRTPTEEAQYQAAMGMLAVTGADGWPEPSPALRAYNQLRDQMFMLQEAFKAAESTATLDPDPAQQSHWRTVEEPRLRQQMRDLETRWINEGFKHEVANAQEVRRRLGAKNPNQTWEGWASRFNADIDALTNTDGVQFFPTSFSPANALESGSWQTFTLTRGEVETMVKAAPAELRSRLAADRQTSEIESISLEFSSAAIVRPWIDTDLFKARFWRFGDRSKQLSNGQTPPAGQCPAYVSALVFARNITVQRRRPPAPPSSTAKPAPSTPEKIEFSQAVQMLKVNPTVAPRPQPPTPPLKVAPSVLTTTAIPSLRVNPAILNSAVLNHGTLRPLMAQPASVSPVTPTVSLSSAKPISARQVQALQGQLGVTKSPSTLRTQLTPELTSRAFLHLQQEAVVRPVLPSVASRPTAPDPSDTALETTTTPSDQIFVLAFICKPLPQCPDPDTALVW